uniref:Uncharacterized protein n=1 Tax=Rhizophora mucronata TaxID=61149 RepID=A0A2P2R4W2_RHIMU
MSKKTKKQKKKHLVQLQRMRQEGKLKFTTKDFRYHRRV